MEKSKVLIWSRQDGVVVVSRDKQQCEDGKRGDFCAADCAWLDPKKKKQKKKPNCKGEG
jgi:hypothetical protein